MEDLGLNYTLLITAIDTHIKQLCLCHDFVKKEETALREDIKATIKLYEKELRKCLSLREKKNIESGSEDVEDIILKKYMNIK